MMSCAELPYLSTDGTACTKHAVCAVGWVVCDCGGSVWWGDVVLVHI